MSTHPRLAPAGLVVLSLVLAGCGVDSVQGIGEPTNDLDGNYVSEGAPGPPFRDGSEPIRLTLHDGEIAFTAACNHFSGRATWDDGVLRTSALGGTEMGCPGARQTQDDWMIEFFGSEPTIHSDGTDIRLRSGQDEVWFVPASQGRSGEPGNPDKPVSHG